MLQIVLTLYTVEETMSDLSANKLILVIGATGAQGLAVIDALLAPKADGSPSPYRVRALTRDAKSKRAQELSAKGVECVEGLTRHLDEFYYWLMTSLGTFMDFDSVERAMKGAYGAWINTDGFTVGEQKEVFAGMRIFETAKQVGTLRHYIWSSIDYAFKVS